MNLHDQIRKNISTYNMPGLCLVYVPVGLALGNNIGGQPHAAFPISDDQQVAVEGLQAMRQAAIDANQMRLLFIKDRPVGTILDQQADLVMSIDFDMTGGQLSVHKCRGIEPRLPDTFFVYEW